MCTQNPARYLKLAWGLQHSAEALVSGSTGGGARIPPSPTVRPPSALLLPSWGVSEPVLAVETVAWVSTPFPFSSRQQAGRAGTKKSRRGKKEGLCFLGAVETAFVSIWAGNAGVIDCTRGWWKRDPPSLASSASPAGNALPCSKPKKCESTRLYDKNGYSVVRTSAHLPYIAIYRYRRRFSGTKVCLV